MLQAIVISMLLYYVETWTLHSKQLNQMKKFDKQCFRRMIGITWKNRVPNNEIFARSCSSGEGFEMVGHMQRMPEERLPKAVFYPELA